MSNPVKVEWLFPVPLFQKQTDDFDSYQQPLVEFVERLQTSDQGVKRSNVGGWHSNDVAERLLEPPLSWLYQQILEMVRTGLKQYRGVSADVDVHMDSAWFNVNAANDWNSPHTHMPSQWSGVFYLSVDSSNAGANGGRLVFVDPIPLGPVYRNPINAHVEPRNGLILIFPSYLTHMVEPHSSDRQRLSFSFNCTVRVKQ